MPRDILALIVIVAGVLPMCLAVLAPSLLNGAAGPFDYVHSQCKYEGTRKGSLDDMAFYTTRKPVEQLVSEIIRVRKPLMDQTQETTDASGAYTERLLSYERGVISLFRPQGQGVTNVVVCSPGQARVRYGVRVYSYSSRHTSVRWRSGSMFRGGSFSAGK